MSAVQFNHDLYNYHKSGYIATAVLPLLIAVVDFDMKVSDNCFMVLRCYRNISKLDAIIYRMIAWYTILSLAKIVTLIK